MGRPSKYKDEYCQQLIDFLSEGYSLEAFCGKIGISKDTLYNWFDKHSAFSYAKSIAVSKSLEWWEKQGITGLWDITEHYSKGELTHITKKLNSTVWIFSMKNRHGWRDAVNIETDKALKFILPEFLTNDKKPKAD